MMGRVLKQESKFEYPKVWKEGMPGHGGEFFNRKLNLSIPKFIRMDA